MKTSEGFSLSLTAYFLHSLTLTFSHFLSLSLSLSLSLTNTHSFSLTRLKIFSKLKVLLDQKWFSSNKDGTSDLRKKVARCCFSRSISYADANVVLFDVIDEASTRRASGLASKMVLRAFVTLHKMGFKFDLCFMATLDLALELRISIWTK